MAPPTDSEDTLTGSLAIVGRIVSRAGASPIVGRRRSILFQ